MNLDTELINIYPDISVKAVSTLQIRITVTVTFNSLVAFLITIVD